jgi:hypothetical protein
MHFNRLANESRPNYFEITSPITIDDDNVWVLYLVIFFQSVFRAIHLLDLIRQFDLCYFKELLFPGPEGSYFLVYEETFTFFRVDYSICNHFYRYFRLS